MAKRPSRRGASAEGARGTGIRDLSPTRIEVRRRLARAPVRRGLHREAVNEIGSRIVRGEYRAGDVLIEADLVQQLGISRSGIREAIKVLAAKGLVESRTKVGTTIRPREGWNLFDPDLLRWWSTFDGSEDLMRMILDVRLLIEPGAAALAAERADAEAIQRLSDAYEAMLTHGGDPQRAVEADVDYHIAILEACDNELIHSLAPQVEAMFLASFKIISAMPDALTRATALHGTVVDAIKAHDPLAAREAMNVLLADAREYVLGTYRCRKRRDGDLSRKS